MNAVNPSDEISRIVPRRERLRAATEAEILATARELLVEGGLAAVSLREVGRRMGMTASALYRYYDGLPTLLDALGAQLFDELNAHLGIEVLPGGRLYPTPSTGHEALDGLIAASWAFREWAIGHPDEFTFMFTCRELGPIDRPLTALGAEAFGTTFARLFMTGADVRIKDADGTLFGAMPAPLDEAFSRSWVRLLGIVTVEVQGEYRHMAIDPARIFALEMADCGRMLLACFEGGAQPFAAG